MKQPSVPHLIKSIEAKIGSSPWESIRNRLMLTRYIRCAQMVNSLLKPKSLILDIGCGEGQNTYILSQFGHRVIGLELQPHSLWSQLASEFVIYSGFDPPFQPNSFDAVTAYGVLEHVGINTQDPSQLAFQRNQHLRLTILRNLFVSLKPKGFLFIYGFPNPHSPVELALALTNFPVKHGGSEIQTLSQVKALINNAGYKIIHSGRSGVLPVAIGTFSDRIRDQFLNRHYLILDKIDSSVDNILGNYLGQSNYVIAQKPG